MALHGPSIVQPFVNINLYQCTLILNDDLYFCTAWYENNLEMFEHTKKMRGGKKGADCQTSSEHFDIRMTFKIYVKSPLPVFLEHK